MIGRLVIAWRLLTSLTLISWKDEFDKWLIVNAFSSVIPHLEDLCARGQVKMEFIVLTYLDLTCEYFQLSKRLKFLSITSVMFPFLYLQQIKNFNSFTSRWTHLRWLRLVCVWRTGASLCMLYRYKKHNSLSRSLCWFGDVKLGLKLRSNLDIKVYREATTANVRYLIYDVPIYKHMLNAYFVSLANNSKTFLIPSGRISFFQSTQEIKNSE